MFNCLVFKLFVAQFFIFKYQTDAKVYEPTKLTDCSARLDNGVVIDLSSLDNNKSPRF
jgi:hypothetical protein